MAGRRLLCQFVVLVCVVTSDQPHATAQRQFLNREYLLKAGCLVYLGDFVSAWPAGTAPSQANPMTIGVLGGDPFVQSDPNARPKNHLDDAVQTRNRNPKKNIRVLRFASAKDFKACHVLFIAQRAAPNSDEKNAAVRLQAAIAMTAGKPVLLVGDAAGMAARGVAVNILVEGNNLTLEVNPVVAKRHGLTLHPSLLSLPNTRIIRPP